MRTAAVVVAGALLFTVLRFRRAWRLAWAADAADWARIEARTYDSEAL